MGEPSVAKCEIQSRLIQSLHTKSEQYLGPSAGQLVHLFLLTVINSMTLLLVFIMLVRTLWSAGGNITMIEGWEIERHERLVRRARVLGGYLDGPDGIKVKIERQEFLYDIGIWNNLVQNFGTRNIFAWLWPFAATPRESGIEFEVNGFEELSKTWPPPDPDRIPRLQRQPHPSEAFTYQRRPLSDYEEIEAFKRRQEEDVRRRSPDVELRRRKPFHNRYENGPRPELEVADPDTDADESELDLGSDTGSESGEEGWRDPGGNRLSDYGVDEALEFYDEDDIPLSELIRRKKTEKKEP